MGSTKADGREGERTHAKREADKAKHGWSVAVSAQDVNLFSGVVAASDWCCSHSDQLKMYEMLSDELFFS